VTDANAAGGAINELTNRAKLIADLMTRSPLRDEIADRAGVPRDHLLTERPMNGLERRLTLPEVSRATVGTGDREASLLRVGVTPLLEGESPIIGIDVRAPDPARAARLADAAMAAARDYLEQTEAAESPERPLDIQPLAPATGESAVIGPSPVFALLVAVGAFGLGCAATLAGGRLRAGLRREPARA
jgi:hypothetical protein